MPRNNNKINFPTNVVSPITYATYMQMIDTQPDGQVDASYASNTLFPTIKNGKGGEGKRDTHTIAVLNDYGLAEYVDEKTVTLSHFGKRFLEMFEPSEDPIRLKRKDNVDINYNALMLDILLNWKVTVGEKTFFPGALIVRLLMDERLDYKFNAYEWAFICENEEYIETANYDNLVRDIIEFRESGEEIELKKANDFCNSLANSWTLLTKNEEKFYVLREITKNNLEDWCENNRDLLLTTSSVPESQAEDNPDTKEDFKPLVYKTSLKTSYERNRIIFGAPGTGKSYELKKDTDAFLKKTNGTMERVTFHPDYTYSQFVGTYKPISDDKSISYEFVPGPFLRVFVDAIKSGRTATAKPHILIIEEINRAKVAAVFGDVFQLLDRDEDGVSEYEIQTSEDIRKYLAKELGGAPNNYSRIKIPNNMFIWATMNSADQGVFPMDTAFKRRWSFEYLGINTKESEIRGKIKLGSDVTQEVEWNTLRRAINEKLANEYKINEDKLMGPFFLTQKVLRTVSDENDNIADVAKFIEVFKSKVIMYLYEDAAKQHKHKLFSGCEDTTKYSAVCDSFDKIGIQIFGEDFEEVYYNPQRG